MPNMNFGESLRETARRHFFRARRTARYRESGLVEFAKSQIARDDGLEPFGSKTLWKQWLKENCPEALE